MSRDWHTLVRSRRAMPCLVCQKGGSANGVGKQPPYPAFATEALAGPRRTRRDATFGELDRGRGRHSEETGKLASQALSPLRRTVRLLWLPRIPS